MNNEQNDQLFDAEERFQSYEDYLHEQSLKENAQIIVEEFKEAIEEEEEEEEEVVSNKKSKLVSIFRLKLLEAQLHESLSDIMKDNNIHQTYESNSEEESGNFIHEIDNKIEEIQKWRIEQIDHLKAELEKFEEEDDVEKEGPETQYDDEKESDDTLIAEKSLLTQGSPSKLESLKTLILGLQKEHEDDAAYQQSSFNRNPNQDCYNNSVVEANRIEHDARIASSQNTADANKQQFFSDLDFERDFNIINHSLAANNYELDRILAKL